MYFKREGLQEQQSLAFLNCRGFCCDILPPKRPQMASPGFASVVRFNGFEFDPSSRELRKGRTNLKVPDQSLEILAMLLERPGELVTRESIQARLWPNGTVVEFEHSVNSAIKRLRQALLDTANEPRFIETLPRKGYRFIGVLEVLPDEPAALTPGTIISHYRILNEVGRGAMGVVYKAEDTTLGRMVALKFLPEELASHPPALERLRREARMIAGLNNPGICTMHELGEASGRVFLAMEFLEGETLRQRTSRQPLTQSEIIDIGVQAAKALEAAHAAGMVHRDIKPDNLFLTKQGTVKLMDFGLAKPVEEQTGEAQQSSVTGTSGYMSPEQLRGEPLDARSDIYSLGKVLEELACEKPLRKLAPILSKALADEPSKRWQSAGELAQSLDASRRKKWPYIAALTAAVVLIAAIAALIVGQRLSSSMEDLHPVPLVSMSGLTSYPTFSPDGNRIAFDYDDVKVGPEDGSGTYVKLIAAGPPLRLLPGRFDYAPAWSPDDRNIAFLRTHGKTSSIMLVPSIGGSAREVANLDVADACTLSWTPDARWLILSARESPDEPYSIWRVSVDTGELRPVLPPPARKIASVPGWSFGDLLSSLSPDGRTLVFFRSLSTWHFDLYYVGLTRELQANGTASRLPVPIDAQVFNSIAWSGEKEIVLHLNPADAGLFRMRVGPQSVPRRLTWSEPADMWPAISRSKHRMAYIRFNANQNLWQHDLRTGQERMIIGSSSYQQYPQYSPDDGKIAFQSARSGPGAVWTCESDGENCQQITSFGGTTGGTPRWSPDGQWLAYDSRQEGTSQIYVIGASGGQPRRVTSGEGDNMMPSWSRDGRWLYFNSSRSGQYSIWKTPVNGGEPVKVTRSGGGAAFESFDGKSLYFTSGRGDTFALMRMPVGGGQEKEIAPSVPDWAGFAVTAKGVYFKPDERTVQFLDEKTGRIKTVARVVPERISYAGITVSADDHYLVYCDGAPGARRDLLLVEGFR